MKRLLGEGGQALEATDFPGYQAGASLKLPKSPPLPHGARNFPGYQAGASLKRVRRPDGVAHGVRDFPGYQAGASLKPMSESSKEAQGHLTSPVTKPGPH